MRCPNQLLKKLHEDPSSGLGRVGDRTSYMQTGMQIKRILNYAKIELVSLSEREDHDLEGQEQDQC